jgi:galactose-1-phosphate uridylyltransferase
VRLDQCIVCEELAREVDDGARLVATAGDWVAWVPFASGYAYGLRIAPRAHVGSIPALGTLSNPVVPEDAAEQLRNA